MGLLCWGIPNGLVALLHLGTEKLGDMIWHLTQQGYLVDIGGVFEQALSSAFLDDLPDCGLGKGPEVHLLLVLLKGLSSLN
jgi:hypothetical protein